MKTLTSTNFMSKVALGFVSLAAVLLCATAFTAPLVSAGTEPGGNPPAGAPGATPPSAETCKKNFFGLVPWYKYIDMEFTSNHAAAEARRDPCAIKCFNLFTKSKPNDCGKTGSDVPAVLLAIVDNLLRIAGMVAVAFVIVGAFQYVTSGGKPEDTAKAQSTIVNALMGLAIAIVAISFVSFVGNRLGG